ncbi:hypothetical protein [Parapedobacter tibetensis]|uniref:hypothetical protein n=1 Tax=Parapedobacter tibetensis TaxID=2972951 RepID=UPI00214DDD46|nr:hypothetical protein [Parapedobacter tibetensis]
MQKHSTYFSFFSLKHAWVMLALASVGALLLYGNGMGLRWALIFTNRHYLIVFSVVFAVSLTAVTLVDFVTSALNGFGWANRRVARRGWMQVAVGVVGVGVLTYGLQWLLFEWLLDGVFRFSPNAFFLMVYLLHMALVNLVVLFIHGILRLKPTGATPKSSYLTHLLTLEGNIPATAIQFCYHHRHKMNRVCLRGSAKRSDPVLENTLDELEKGLDAREFMRIAPDMIIHQSAITDDGVRLPNRNRQVRLVVPYTKVGSDGVEREIAEVSISRRRVSRFDQWRKAYRLQD